MLEVFGSGHWVILACASVRVSQENSPKHGHEGEVNGLILSTVSVITAILKF